jgi:hypothetical protein
MTTTQLYYCHDSGEFMMRVRVKFHVFEFKTVISPVSAFSLKFEATLSFTQVQVQFCIQNTQTKTK